MDDVEQMGWQGGGGREQKLCQGLRVCGHDSHIDKQEGASSAGDRERVCLQDCMGVQNRCQSLAKGIAGTGWRGSLKFKGPKS